MSKINCCKPLKFLLPILILGCLTVGIVMMMDAEEKRFFKEFQSVEIESVEKIWMQHVGDNSQNYDSAIISDPVQISTIVAAIKEMTYEGTFEEDVPNLHQYNPYHIMFSKYHIVLMETGPQKGLFCGTSSKWIRLGNTDEVLRCAKKAFLESSETW